MDRRPPDVFADDGRNAAASGSRRGRDASATSVDTPSRARELSSSDLFLLPRNPWREIRVLHVCRIYFLHQFAIGLRLVAHALPVRIILKRFPVRRSGLAARMPQNVDERVALLRIVERRPLADALHAVLGKDFHGVLAKARQQLGQLPGSGVIDAQFEDTSRRLLRALDARSGQSRRE